ncbi:MAG: N-acetyltransferase family protein [Dehalococcoidia bacterium]
MEAGDWPAVARIFEEGIATGNATFETKCPDRDEWDRSHLESCRLIAERGGAVVGWAALSPYSDRYAYRGVVEVSIYIAAKARGTGVGKVLLLKLIECAEVAGFWTLQAGIFPENEASLHLHEAAGFREVGRRERIGQLKDVWRDVVLLERRGSLAEGAEAG